MDSFNVCFNPANITERPSGLFWFVSNGYYIKIYAAIQAAIGVISTVGNLLVLLSVRHETKKIKTKARRQKHLFKYTKASLSLCDLLSAMSLIFVGMVEFESFCQVPTFSLNLDWGVASLQGPFQTISFYHLMFMGVQRYLAVTQPFSQTTFSQRKFFFCLSLVSFE